MSSALRDEVHFSQIGRITLCGLETTSRSTGRLATFASAIRMVTCDKCKTKYAERERKT